MAVIPTHNYINRFSTSETAGKSIQDLITDIGAAPAIILVESDETLTANLVVPTNIDMAVQRGYQIIHGVNDVTFNGRLIVDGDYQVLNGTGTVLFVGGLQKEVRPIWFGDSIQKALTSLQTTGGDMLVTSDQIVTGNIASPSTMDWKVSKNSVINHGTSTITIDGDFQVDQTSQVFDGTGAVQFKAKQVVQPLWFGDSLEKSKNSITANGGKLLVTTNQTLTAAFENPANTVFEVENNCQITHGAFVITLNGQAILPNSHVWVGTGNILYKTGTVEFAKAEWYGGIADDTTDSTTAINKAMADVEVSQIRDVVLSGGIWKASQVQRRMECSLKGISQSNQTTGGTVLKQTAGANMDFVVDHPTVVSHQHTELSDMHVLGDLTNTSGKGIFIDNPPFESFIMHDIQVSNFQEHGIHIEGNIIPLYTENIHLFGNGQSGSGSGMYLERTAGGNHTMVVLNHTSGDDNHESLITIDQTSASVGSYVITGTKAEANTAGKQQNAIILQDCLGSILINGLHGSAGPIANSLIQINGSKPQLHALGLYAQSSRYAKLIDDTVNGDDVLPNAAGNINNHISDSEFIFNQGFKVRDDLIVTDLTTHRVGIGVEPATATLHIEDTTQPALALTSSTYTTGLSASFFGLATANNEFANLSLTGDTVISAKSDGNLRFGTNTVGLAQEVRMSVMDDGKVGINEIAPNNTLHIDGHISMTEQTVDPNAPAQDAELVQYMKDNKIIYQYDDAGTIRYKYLDLTGTGVTWVHTTVAP